MEQTFRAVTRTPGIIIWRIEKMELVVVPEKSHGNFFEGDCYLLLCTKKSGSMMKYNVHYWMGAESSQDEQGAAAVYAFQLDDFLGSNPIQYREVQHSESSTFCAYFKQGIIYKKGGMASGMKHVVTNSSDVQRLLQVKGKRSISAKEVEMSWSSFNLGDVFLLDNGNLIIQWNGPESRTQERLKAMLLAKDIRDRERGGRAEIGVIEGDAEDKSQSLMKVLCSVLGERPASLPGGTSDENADQEQMSQVTLYHVSDADGEMKVNEIASRPLVQDLLNHEDSYIVDQGGVKLFVWKGKKANKSEKQEAMSRAVEFIKQKGYPHSTSVEVVHDGAESALFKQLFQTWSVKDQTVGMGRTHNVGRIAHVTQEKFDAMTLHVMPEVAAQQRMVDDGSGQVQVWRIENLELAEIDPKLHGYFYGGDCYLILYTYEVNNKKNYILYMWLGRHTSQDEMTACAFQAVALDQQYDNQPVQVRVKMGKEPRHFMAMFKGRMVVFEGGTSREAETEEAPSVHFFQVSGTELSNTKAIEVPAVAASLNSNDVFLLKSPSTVFLWYGKGSSGDERAMAKEVAAFLGQGLSQEVMAEGQEPIEFWQILGGKTPYANDKRLQQAVTDHEPRLFECSNKTGKFIVTEVSPFTQDDLNETDIMLLDTWDQVFLWMGAQANDTEKKESIITCQEYLRTHPGMRDPETPILLIKQGFEPPTFTGWFLAWDPSKWSGGKTYEQLKEEMGVVTEAVDVTTAGETADGASSDQSGAAAEEDNRVYESFPPEALINKSTEELPEGVDAMKREKHLSDEDFVSIFQMSKDEFNALPQWKQLDCKKKHGLF
ncbi:advillin [Neoarius graeffei]|uniref:advillin n=1 Tax=Neoarius graeffei TaxID=443677 RepID=UPI00298D4CEE|nr:advillin [Neoarius graeffei]XP_060766258.1 advillin [Neoarius graeffei]